MKIYTAPKLVDQGTLVERTRGAFLELDDPDMISSIEPFGSVGFGL